MNKSTILTFVSAAGVVATAILAAKGTMKASILLKEAKEEKGEELTKAELIKMATPVYIPAIAVGLSTIVCIFGTNALNQRTQVSLASAYALLDSSYKEYRNKVTELYGEEADLRVKSEMAKDQLEEDEPLIPEGEQLFYDLNSMQYFTSTIDEVLQKATFDDGMECYIISTPFDTLPPWD